MKYTVLGSTGFIGSRLTIELKSRGIECFLPEKGHAFSKDHNLGHAIYCIGLTADFRRRPIETVKAHVTELIRVLETSQFDSFLYLSSTRVYSGSSTGVEDQILQVNPQNSSDLYNLSKLMGEAVCFATNNERVRVARLSNVVGNDFQSENFLFSLIKEAVSNKQINLQTPLSASKDYIAIDDVVEALIAISHSGKSRLYNVASGINLSNQMIIDEIVRLTGSQVSVNATQPYLKFPTISVERLKSEFGLKPKNIIENLAHLIQTATT